MLLDVPEGLLGYAEKGDLHFRVEAPG